LHAGGDWKTFAKEDVEYATQDFDGFGGHAGTAHADHVEVDDGVESLDHGEARNVLGGDRGAAQEAQPADAAELVHGGVAGQINAVLKDAVPAHEGAVGENAVVAHL